MYLRDFRYVLRRHRFDRYIELRKRGAPIELRIRRRIPNRYEFGDAGKVVLELGADKPSGPVPQYRELLGVALYHCPDFDPKLFLAKSETRQRREIIELTSVAMSAFAERFAADITWLKIALEEIEQENAEPSDARETSASPVLPSRSMARSRDPFRSGDQSYRDSTIGSESFEGRNNESWWGGAYG